MRLRSCSWLPARPLRRAREAAKLLAEQARQHRRACRRVPRRSSGRRSRTYSRTGWSRTTRPRQRAVFASHARRDDRRHERYRLGLERRGRSVCGRLPRGRTRQARSRLTAPIGDHWRARADGPFWWSNRGDSIDTRLTREFDLSGLTSATLRFSTWYEIEEAGTTRTSPHPRTAARHGRRCPASDTTDYNPVEAAYGPGYTR